MISLKGSGKVGSGCSLRSSWIGQFFVLTGSSLYDSDYTIRVLPSGSIVTFCLDYSVIVPAYIICFRPWGLIDLTRHRFWARIQSLDMTVWAALALVIGSAFQNHSPSARSEGEHRLAEFGSPQATVVQPSIREWCDMRLYDIPDGAVV